LEETRTITLDKYDYKLIINALNEFRNAKLQENIDTEIIDRLIVNLLHAPTNKKALSLNKHAKGRYTIEGR
jgi:hypothetical protein